jgi:DNA (cytosine-5)-methyltransferase 1
VSKNFQKSWDYFAKLPGNPLGMLNIFFEKKLTMKTLPVLSSLQSRVDTASDRVWKSDVFGPNNFKTAVISHYLRSKNRTLKRTAIQFSTDLLHGYLKDELSYTVAEDALQYLIRFTEEVPFPKPPKPDFTFIDLFAGIGGFRIAMQALNGECVFSSEWDKMAQKTYYSNFGEIPFGDITTEETKSWIPKKFDVLCGGFPCQPFSLAGVSKKNALGRKHGFEDERQGNLFFHIVKILEKHRPKAFFLENVKNLVSHDKGNTFKIIKETLEELGYTFHFKVLDGQHFVPQHRQRTFMIGFDRQVFKGKETFTFPVMPQNRIYELSDVIENRVDPRYTLSEHLWGYLKEYARKHKEKGNGFGYGLFDKNVDKVTRTISARYYKDGAEVLIKQENTTPRRLTPRECARLQGYPENFMIPVSDNQAYKQFGNSVVVPLIKAIGNEVVEVLKSKPKSNGYIAAKGSRNR